ncbi:MAG: hypothetical protein P8R54_28525 [Myxococcota bacterium]|nr:hypothetical protein [Myxococcota bacterium]
MLDLLQQCHRDGCLPDIALRLARQVPDLRAALEAMSLDPIQRALAGLGTVAVAEQSCLADRVRVGIALGDRLDAKTAAALEKEASGDDTWWIPAGRLHALVSQDRERAGRMALSDQNLPYVFPGELHPLQIDIFAVGDRVLPALHVDWVRKLTGLAAQAVEQDCAALGLWTHPLLGILDERPLVRAIDRVRRSRRMPPGARGLAALYLEELGHDSGRMLAGASPTDDLIVGLARQARAARR